MCKAYAIVLSNIMNINTIKTFLVAAIACFISCTVVLSAAHAKDLVKDQLHDNTVMGRTSDTVSKAISDLHNHTDKQTLKAISMDNPVTAREREIKALKEEKSTRNIVEILEDLALFYRLAWSLRFSVASA